MAYFKHAKASKHGVGDHIPALVTRGGGDKLERAIFLAKKIDLEHPTAYVKLRFNSVSQQMVAALWVVKAGMWTTRIQVSELWHINSNIIAEIKVDTEKFLFDHQGFDKHVSEWMAKEDFSISFFKPAENEEEAEQLIDNPQVTFSYCHIYTTNNVTS